MENARKIERKNRKLKKAVALVNLVKSNKLSQPDIESTDQMEGTVGTGTSSKQRRENGGGESEKCTPRLHMNQILAKHVMNMADQSEMDALKEAKRIQSERNKLKMQSPHIVLTPEEMLPFQPVSEDVAQPPIYPLDVQQLLLFALHGTFTRASPRWCKLKRASRVSCVVVITLDGLGYSEFVNDQDSFPFIKASFQSQHMEMVSPEQYGTSVDEEIYAVPLSITQIKKSNVKVAAGDKQQIAAKMRPGKTPPSDKFSRACLLLSSQQMKQEGYPMPIQTDNNVYRNFVFTKEKYKPVKADSPLYGLDCEMCLTTAGRNELTRVSVVGEDGEAVYDSLVLPYNKITNYNTKYSGITAELMKGVTVRIEDVQNDLRTLLPADAILCGQSLNFDLIAIKMFHPYVIDTSIIFNMSGNRRCKAGLKKLSGFFLNRNIQCSSDGHSSVEDAKASLDLVKLKLEKGLEFGDATISGTYFPDIQTYFLGEQQQEQAAMGAVQNVETTSQRELLKRPLDNPEERCSSAKKMLKTSDSQHSVPSEAYSAVQRQTMFGQNNSVHLSKSFFKLVSDDAGRTGCIIGKDWFTSKYRSEPIQKVTVKSDEAACQSAINAVEKKEFVWVNLDTFRRVVTDPERTDGGIEEAQQRLDEHVKKIVESAKEKSLVVVMATGRFDVNAGVFVKVVNRSLES